MENSPEMANHIVSHIQERAKLYVIVILIFGYHFLFEEELMCSCENPSRDCILNMALPVLIILFALLWTDKHCQRACCHRRVRSTIIRLVHAVFVSLIWPASALIDGDWTVCCFHSSLHNITCKEEDHLSEDERRILNGLKDESRLTGLYFLLGMFFLAFLASLIQKKIKCSTKDNWEAIVLEEEDKFVPQKMREVAQLVLLDKLKNHIPQSSWEKCFSVGEEVLTDPPPEETLSRITAAVTGTMAQADRESLSDGGTHSQSESSPLLPEH